MSVLANRDDANWDHSAAVLRFGARRLQALRLSMPNRNHGIMANLSTVPMIRVGALIDPFVYDFQRQAVAA
jgi:hypothetical protein